MRVQRRFERREYGMYVGVDTGARLMLGAVSRDAATGETEGFTKYESKTYTWDVGDQISKDRRIFLTKTTLKKKENDRRVFALSDPLTHNDYHLTKALKIELPPPEDLPKMFHPSTTAITLSCLQ